MTRRSVPPRADELPGYLEGVRRRLADSPRRADPALQRLLADGEAALAAHDPVRAEARLRALDAALDAARPEDGLREWPRGLVSFSGPGEFATEVDPAEDPVANRLLILQRLLAVRRSQGWPVDALAEELGEADRAYRAGDRRRAKAIGDRVHARLESAARDPGGTPPRSGGREP